MKSIKKNTALLLFTSILLLNGCDDDTTTVEKIAQEKKESVTKVHTDQKSKISMHGAKDGKTDIEKTENMPHPMPPFTAVSENTSHSGIVLEVLQATPYVYAKVKENGRVFWIAAPEVAVKVGAKVTFDEQMVMQNFTSKTLKRTFETVLFASRLNMDASTEKSKEAIVNKEPEEMQNTLKEHTITTQTKEDDTNQTTKKTTLRTIEQIYAQADDLNNTVIHVKGKVVKVLEGIMGRNWIHLQDGTGTQGTNDLVFTSKNITVTVGDEVNATGLLKTNIDFGYGYAYSVIIENSKFTK